MSDHEIIITPPLPDGRSVIPCKIDDVAIIMTEVMDLLKGESARDIQIVEKGMGTCMNPGCNTRTHEPYCSEECWDAMPHPNNTTSTPDPKPQTKESDGEG